MIFECIEPDSFVIEIPMHAVADNPARMTIRLIRPEITVRAGDRWEGAVLNIANTGGSVLNFRVEAVIIQAPDDDRRDRQDIINHQWQDSEDK